MRTYFSFQKMITGQAIKLLYFIGFVMLTVLGVGLIVKGFQDIQALKGLETFNQGAAVLIAGNLLWRLICELWILFFSIHERLVSIEALGKKDLF